MNLEIPNHIWDDNNSRSIETSPDITTFLKEYVELCKKHKLVFSHQDCHGAFEIAKLSEKVLRWNLNANDNTKALNNKNQKIQDDKEELSRIEESKLKDELAEPFNYKDRIEWQLLKERDEANLREHQRAFNNLLNQNI